MKKTLTSPQSTSTAKTTTQSPSSTPATTFAPKSTNLCESHPPPTPTLPSSASSRPPSPRARATTRNRATYPPSWERKAPPPAPKITYFTRRTCSLKLRVRDGKAKSKKRENMEQVWKGWTDGREGMPLRDVSKARFFLRKGERVNVSNCGEVIFGRAQKVGLSSGKCWRIGNIKASGDEGGGVFEMYGVCRMEAQIYLCPHKLGVDFHLTSRYGVEVDFVL